MTTIQAGGAHTRFVPLRVHDAQDLFAIVAAAGRHCPAAGSRPRRCRRCRGRRWGWRRGWRTRSHYGHRPEGHRGPAEDQRRHHGDFGRGPGQRRRVRHPRRAEPDAAGPLPGGERLDRTLHPRRRFDARPAQYRATQRVQFQRRVHPARGHERRPVRYRVDRVAAGTAGHAVRTRGARRRRQRRVQPTHAGTRDERRARGRRLFAAPRHDRAEPAGVGTTRAARRIRLRRTRRLPADGRGFPAGLRRPALGALRADRRSRRLRLAARREKGRQVAEPRAPRLQQRYLRRQSQRVQHQRPLGRPHRPGCAHGVATGLREHGARRAGRLGPRRCQAHVHPRLFLPGLGRGLLAREHSSAAHRALQPGHQRVAPRERLGLEAAVARRPVCLPGDELRRFHRWRLSALADFAQPARGLCGLWRGDVFADRGRALHGGRPVQLGPA